VNLKPFRFWKGEILSLGLVLSVSLIGAGPLWAHHTAGFAYVATITSVTGIGNISAYDIDATTGALTPVPGSPFAVGSVSSSVAVSPNGRFAYVAAVNPFTGMGNVSAYTINATTGALTPVPGSPFAAGLASSSVAVSPNGQFAYVTNGSDGDQGIVGSVSAYTINAMTGALTPVPGSPFTAGLGPRSVAVSPDGQFAYVANVFSKDIAVYAINATTGALTPVPGSPFAVGSSPGSVTVHPSGQFAYVTMDGVAAYTINATTGALTPVPGSPFATEAFPAASVTVHPSGQFVYTAIPFSGVAAYTINATTGALAPLPGSPFAAGFQPNSVAVSANGQFAYVANENSRDVSAYTIDATTGALTPVPGSPFAVGAFPVSVTTAAPAKSCKHHEDRDRDERDDHDEQREDRRQDDHEREDRGRDGDQRRDHLRIDGKHGCHRFHEKDSNEHDNDDAHERERDRF
jgi:6-phosphogluconolactonase